MAPNATRELSHYFVVLNRCSDQLFCPHCNESLLPKQFENHVFKQHGINGKNTCVWCQQMSWPSGEKHKHKKHLMACFKDFIKSRRRLTTIQSNDPVQDIEDPLDQDPVPSNSNDDYSIDVSPDPIYNVDIRPYRLLDMTHSFPEKRFFGHRMPHPDPMFYTLEEFLNIPVHPLPQLPPPRVAFADENLNLAASCVLFYLSDTHDFFHVMIKLPVVECFLQAMNEDHGNSYMLPFSCWCDGGAYKKAEYRQHRHVIVASLKDHFIRNVWSKVEFPRDRQPPKPNFLCKTFKKIVSPRHLVNTIGYLSTRMSRCNFSFDQKKTKPRRNNHFYFYRTLPKDFKLHLHLLWNNGAVELLKQTKLQNVSVAKLATGVLTHDGKQWTQKIKDFYKLDRGLIAHVARDYVPTNSITPHFLHLAEGRMLYFKKSPDHRNLDPEVWLRKQIRGGNCFYDAVEESKWIPRPKDQAVLNFHKPLVDRCRELEESNREKDERMKSLMEELKSLQSKLEETRLKMQQYTDQIIQCKDGEIARLRRENYKQKQKINRLLNRNN